MNTESKMAGSLHPVSTRLALLMLGAAATITAAHAAQVPDPPSAGTAEPIPFVPHMSEALRSSVRKVVVISGRGPANQAVTGTYEKDTAGLVGGMEAGSQMGTISREIGGVPISIPIPGLAIPGAIFGGLSGAAKREIQDFRDNLAEELADADSTPLRSDGLAIDTFWGIRRLPQVESHLFSPTVEIPTDTDAVLYVIFDDLTIDVQGKDAVITTSAEATLRSLDDGRNIYRTIVHYEDRDTLGNWTENENELWRDYTNFARYFLAREVAAEVFDRVELDHELLPKETDSAKLAKRSDRKFVSKSSTPTLAWQLTLEGGDAYPWTESIDEAEIFYDIEIFDNRQLVYDEKEVPDPYHTLAYELEPCRTYRWSVRPSYRVDGETRFGEWMRLEPVAESGKKADADAIIEIRKGIFGRQASEAPAYIQDFASLEIACGRR